MTEQELRNSFNKMLDEVYGDFFVAGERILASTILESCEPTLYKEGLRDYSTSIKETGE